MQIHKNKTNHMINRMRQRRISNRELDVVLEIGEWQNGDRIILTEQICAHYENILRKEIKLLEQQLH